jgi:hypothetical protein
MRGAQLLLALPTIFKTDPFRLYLSELQPHGKLNQPRAAQRPAGRPHCCGCSRADRLRDLAEVGVGQTRHRVGEVGVIEEIEEVGLERQLRRFTNQGEVLRHLKVPIVQARPVILIAA